MRNRWMTRLRPAVAVALLCGAATAARAADQELLDKIKALEQRITQLEGSALTTNSLPTQTLAFLGKSTLSGYVSASFFHSFNDSAPVAGYVNKNDQFAFNKLKLALEKPVDYNKDKFDVGYRADVVIGEDAKILHSQGLGNPGEPFELTQGFININVPIGNGLKIQLGKMVTLMGMEVVEETVNPNWTLGNQFLYVENTAQTGALLSYRFNDKVEAQLAIFNGWDRAVNVVPNNPHTALSYMGKVNLTLSDKTSVSVLGYGGSEQNGPAGGSGNWRKGGEVILTQKVGSKLTIYAQGDYGQEDHVGTVNDADWYAAGLWGVYQFSDKVALAVRGDFLVDNGATRTGFGPAGSTPNVLSLTTTLNLSPIPNLQVRPELRWDHCSKEAYTSKSTAKSDQILLGVGVAYLF